MGLDDGLKAGESQPVSGAVQKNAKGMKVFMLVYVLVAIIAYVLNVAENETLIPMVTTLATWIPSVQGTAQLSPHENYARLMLVCSWLYVIPCYAHTVASADFARVQTKRIEWLFMATALLSACFLWMSMYAVPSDSGGRTRMIYGLITSFDLGIAVWGFILWLVASMLLSSLTIMIVVMIRKLCSNP